MGSGTSESKNWYSLILLIALSTCIRSFAIVLVFGTSVSENYLLSCKKGGRFKQAPLPLSKSSISNPLSGIQNHHFQANLITLMCPDK